jgi:hypothetical protein
MDSPVKSAIGPGVGDSHATGRSAPDQGRLGWPTPTLVNCNPGTAGCTPTRPAGRSRYFNLVWHLIPHRQKDRILGSALEWLTEMDWLSARRPGAWIWDPPCRRLAGRARCPWPPQPAGRRDATTWDPVAIREVPVAHPRPSPARRTRSANCRANSGGSGSLALAVGSATAFFPLATIVLVKARCQEQRPAQQIRQPFELHHRRQLGGPAAPFGLPSVGNRESFRLQQLVGLVHKQGKGSTADVDPFTTAMPPAGPRVLQAFPSTFPRHISRSFPTRAFAMDLTL